MGCASLLNDQPPSVRLTSDLVSRVTHAAGLSASTPFEGVRMTCFDVFSPGYGQSYPALPPLSMQNAPDIIPNAQIRLAIGHTTLARVHEDSARGLPLGSLRAPATSDRLLIDLSPRRNFWPTLSANPAGAACYSSSGIPVGPRATNGGEPWIIQSCVRSKRSP